MGFVNQKAFEGTVLAHNDGGVPNIVLNAVSYTHLDVYKRQPLQNGIIFVPFIRFVLP